MTLNNNDLISRQAAIEAYNEAMRELVETQMKELDLIHFSECSFNTTDCPLIAKRIEELPSIPSEHGRLIDADRLLQETFTVDEEEWTTPEIRTILENAPTVITPTERTGEWVSLFDGNEWSIHCSKCKTQHYEEDLLMGGSELPNFCPNCGAKMGGDTE